jgi:hypothetical protein
MGMLSVLASAVAFVIAHAQTISEAPPSEAALKAMDNYTSELRKLDDYHARRLDALRQHYIKELDIARKAALEKEDLDEAQRLLVEKRQAESTVFRPGAIRGLEIVCAVYGIDSQWLDITPRVRSLASNRQFHYAPEDWRSLPDYAPGRHKSIIIIYTLHGKTYVSNAENDQVPFDLPKR